MSPPRSSNGQPRRVCCSHSRPRAAFPPKGDQAAIDRWLPAIKQSKAAIIAELQLERRRAKVLSMLRDNPGIRYAIEVADANTDPVSLSIGIRNVATFEMNIPQAYYDASALLELIEKHTGDEHANA
jgi:hypothetical protein